jgi:opacity protein-like surface antigen
MKKTIAFTALLLAVGTLALKAQDDYPHGFYVKPTGSYFIKVTPVEFPAISGMPARDRSFTINPQTGETTTTSEKALTGSFGEGWRAGLTFGYRFNRILGVELGVNMYQSTEQDMMRQNGTLGGNTVLSLNTVGKIRAYDVAPALVAYVPVEGMIKPYTKVGIIVPVGGYLQINTTLDDKTGQFAQEAGFTSPIPATHIALALEREERINPRPTVGFQAAVGTDFMISDHCSVFVEVEYRNISVGGKDKELKKYSGTATVVSDATLQPVPGAPQTPITMENASASQKDVTYHSELTPGMNVEGWEDFDRSRPSDDLRSYVNIGGLGLNAGVKFFLSR